MILKLGVTGPDVVNLELVLQGLGFTGFDVDGNFDNKTENVIKYIQKAHGLTNDGVVGEKTLALLDSLYEPFIANFAVKETPVVVPVVDGSVPTGSEELTEVHPILARKVIQIIELAKREGYNVTVTQGLRTFAEQDKLFKKRPRVTKARGGQSYHNYGVAADLAFVVNGKISWDEKLYKNIGRWASQVGLTWGGNWKFIDYPHLQLASMPGVGQLLATYNKAGGNNAGVKAVWNKFVGG